MIRRFKTGEPVDPLRDYFPEFDAWLEYGVARNFCSEPVCDIHEGYDLTDEEAAIYEEGGEPPCIVIVRLNTEGADHR
jgi:hypothetical protein